MKKVAWPVFIYALILIIFGYMGYQTAGSKISLYAGVGSGTALILTAILSYAGHSFGTYLSLIITGALTAIFAVRYTNTGKEHPAILAVISAAMLIFLLSQILPGKKKR